MPHLSNKPRSRLLIMETLASGSGSGIGAVAFLVHEAGKET
jgi:hypothetical protein